MLNFLSVFDPHRFVNKTEVIVLFVVLTALLYVIVALNRISSLKFLRHAFYPQLLITIFSFVFLALMVSLSITLCTDLIFTRETLYRPFARRKMLSLYLLFCLLFALMLVVVYLVVVYYAYVLFRFMLDNYVGGTNTSDSSSMNTSGTASVGDEEESFKSFVTSAFPSLIAENKSIVDVVLVFAIVFVLTTNVYYVFYSHVDAFDEFNQNGLTGDRLRNTFRFSRSVAVFCSMFAVPMLC